MAGRNIHFSNANLFFSFLAAALVIFFTPRDLTSKVSLFFYDTFQPVLRIGRDGRMASEPLDTDSDAVYNRQEHKRLWKDYKKLQAQLVLLHDENQRLSNIRSELPKLSTEGLIMAEITGTVSNYSHELILNKGSKASVRPGQFVLSENHDAVVGVVSVVTEAASKIRLLTDTMQTLEVRIRRDGTDMDIDAMMFGNGSDTCSISMIDQQRDIREGDTVYAAAVPNKLTIPLVIGEIVAVRPDEQHPLLWKITVRPAEDMTRLSKVAIIVADDKLLIEKGRK